MLKITRPIVFFDIESTGLNPAVDHIIEISLVKLHPDGHREEWTQRVNPGCPIPAESTAVHGITDADVANKPSFKEVAAQVAAYIEGCDLAGYNSNKFDIPMLAEEFLNVGMTSVDLRRCNCIDVQNIYHKKEPRTLKAAYRFYCDADLENAHSANADTEATVDVFLAQMQKYDDLPSDAKGLAEFSAMSKNVDFAGRIVYNDRQQEVFNFGKHKGYTVEEVLLRRDPGYFDWIMKSDFTKDTKRVLTEIKLRCRR